MPKVAMGKTFDEIWDYVKNLEIIDTHEHLPGSEAARARDTDFLREYLSHYFNCDLVSAGLTRSDLAKATDHHLPLMERWNLVEPFWEAARNTGYGRVLDVAVRDLYGAERICRSTLEKIEYGFQESLKPGHYQKVLKEMSKIRVSLLDSDLRCDRTFFQSVLRMDIFISPQTRSDTLAVEEQTGIRITCMDDWLEAAEITMNSGLSNGAVALKSALAYSRSLHYERVTRHDAEKDSGLLFQKGRAPDWSNPCLRVGAKFENFMMHHILGLANERNLVYQFHTGIQEGHGNRIANSDPSLLSNLFLNYPDVDFDLFHMGYPYQSVISVLAKNFPNVFIDMCWAHAISPTASVHALVEWLDSVPANKISAFGGDYSFVDGVYGHQVLARQNVGRALAIKVNAGNFDVERAREIASMLLCENPIRIFRLKV